MIIPSGGFGAFIHMLLTPITHAIDGDLNEDHHYDHIVGNIILYYRTLILIGLIVGVLITYS